MACILYKYKKETATHYVGSSGTEYVKEDYGPWGRGVVEHGKMDLPLGDYPYTIKYGVRPLFIFCETCDCEKQ